MSDNEMEGFDFYVRNHGMFLSDFWNAGYSDLKIEVRRRKDVESGQWWTATWKAYPDIEMSVEAQRWKLLWERIIRRFLVEEAETERLTKIGVEVVQGILRKQRGE